jgi:transposase InsO family protein
MGWTFRGWLFLAIGQHGKPKAIKMDKHPVFRSKLVRRVCTIVGVRLRFSEPGKPWQNGRIERFFGTFKAALQHYTILDRQHLLLSLEQFQFWYNRARPHQHLHGATPIDAWRGVNPFRCVPKSAKLFSGWGGVLKGVVIRR